MARRGKYHDWLTDEGILKIEGWARDGLIEEQIAYNMGITRQTLSAWKNKYPSILDALKKGKEVVDRQVENALLKRALGYEYEEVKQTIEKDDMGRDRKKIEKTLKQVVPDTTAQIFWLKNRKPDVWRNQNETVLSGEVKTSTNPFDGIETEVLEKLAENAKQSI